MKTGVCAVNILFAVALLALAGSAIGAPNRGTEALPIGTSAISDQVQYKLAMLPFYGAYRVFDDLGYQVQGSEVILTGHVVREQTKHNAEKEVSSIGGVTKVVNNIEVF